jgi:hypothetical protein
MDRFSRKVLCAEDISSHPEMSQQLKDRNWEKASWRMARMA